MDFGGTWKKGNSTIRISGGNAQDQGRDLSGCGNAGTLEGTAEVRQLLAKKR